MNTDDAEERQRIADACARELDEPVTAPIPRRWSSVIGRQRIGRALRSRHEAADFAVDFARGPDFTISNVAVTDDGAGFTLTAEANEQLRQSVMQDLERVSANMGFRAREVREVHDGVVAHVDYAGLEARTLAHILRSPVPFLRLETDGGVADVQVVHEGQTIPKVIFPTMLSVKCSGKLADKDTLMDAVEAALKAANISVERDGNVALNITSLDDRKYTEDVITDKVRRLDLE